MSFLNVTRRIAATAALLLAMISALAPRGCGSARAQVPLPTREALPPEIENEFRAADLDRDGSLSREEARGGKVAFSEEFDSLDADRNGIVTLFELGGAFNSSFRRWLSDWEVADKNRNGELSPEELRNAPASVRSILTGRANASPTMTRDEYESLARRQLYRSVDMPSVVPNIFEKRF